MLMRSLIGIMSLNGCRTKDDTSWPSISSKITKTRQVKFQIRMETISEIRQLLKELRCGYHISREISTIHKTRLCIKLTVHTSPRKTKNMNHK